MKVICGTCGNKFDPLKNGGICAHCGMRVSGDVIREAEENNAVQGEKLKDILKSYLNRKLAKDMKKITSEKSPRSDHALHCADFGDCGSCDIQL